MKLIEALKQVKELQRKAEDIRGKIATHCVDMTYETPIYAEQGKQIAEWLQSHGDLAKEVLRLRVAIQKTNLATQVKVELDGKTVEKSIAEWIHRRKDLALMEASCWSKLTDKGIKEGHVQQSNGTLMELKIRRYYDPKERDRKIEIYKSEPALIDAKLEIANAITDLIE